MSESNFESLRTRVYDLSNKVDDKRVLNNPHKGWYIHFVDNGAIYPAYRNCIEPGDHLRDFPALNHLYLRLDWADIEPEEGKFDWSLVDSIFDEWGAFGYKFTFRFCTYETSNPQATPKWVLEAGAKGVEIKSSRGTLWEPNYDDEIFLNKLEDFVAACAKKLDGDPRVEFIDVGTFGTWGEGHTFAGSGKDYTADVLKKHIDIHLRHFKKTILLLNDDYYSTSVNGSGKEAAELLIDYCANKGMGARDDSVCVAFYAKTFGYDTMKNPTFFDHFYETAPVDIELEHYSHISDSVLADCFPFLEALKRSHATYAGFHGAPREWLHKHKEFTRYAGNRLGYWYFVTKLELPSTVSGMKTLAKVTFENHGFAKAYNPYTLKVRVKNDSFEQEVFSEIGRNLRWEDGRSYVENLMLDFAGVPSGKYQLQLGLFENNRAIEFAIKDKFIDNGWCDLAEIVL